MLKKNDTVLDNGSVRTLATNPRNGLAKAIDGGLISVDFVTPLPAWIPGEVVSYRAEEFFTVRRNSNGVVSLYCHANQTTHRFQLSEFILGEWISEK